MPPGTVAAEEKEEVARRPRLVLPATQVNGAVHHCALLSRELARRGHEVVQLYPTDSWFAVSKSTRRFHGRCNFVGLARIQAIPVSSTPGRLGGLGDRRAGQDPADRQRLCAAGHRRVEESASLASQTKRTVEESLRNRRVA